MNDINVQKKLFFAAAGGLVGFFVMLLAVGIVFVAALLAGGFSFGGGIHSWQDNLFIAILVPTLISLGAAIPAWRLGAKWWHGLLAGIIAMIAFIYIESNGGKQVNYSFFSEHETLAYVSTALVSILIAIAARKKFQVQKSASLFAVAAILVVLRLVISDENASIGFAISLLAWVVLPLVGTFIIDIP